MALTIKQKLILIIALIAITVSALIGVSMQGISTLRVMQDQGVKLSEDAAFTEDASNLGARMYQVVADAVINQDLEASRKGWAEVKKNSLEKMARVVKIIDTSEEKLWADEAQAQLNTFIELFERKQLPLLASPNPSVAEIRDIDGQMDASIGKTRENLQRISDSIKEKAKKGDVIFDETGATIIKRTVLIGLSLLVVLVGICFWILFSITRPLVVAVDIANRLAEGDLTAKIDVGSHDEIGQLLVAMKVMVEKLASIISEVRGAADSLSSASEEVSATAQSMSQASSEQAASVEQTSASIEQMSASINQNSENAKVTDGMAAQAAKQATEGGEAVKATVAAMKQIAGKIGIIDDIAYQTNLLALNAAIEAARAGEHGKSFAVVAGEVRKLAERSQKAAREISHVAGSSVELAERAGRLLDEIVPAIDKTSGLVQEITAASEEQSAGVGQINVAMSQLNQITQQNASSSEELAATSEEMTGQAEQLQELMAFFKV